MLKYEKDTAAIYRGGKFSEYLDWRKIHEFRAAIWIIEYIALVFQEFVSRCFDVFSFLRTTAILRRIQPTSQLYDM